MQYDDILALVQERANLPTRARAAAITCAVLQTLAERVQGDTANNLASQLPHQLAEFMHRPPGVTGEQFPVDEFTHRISDRADIEPDEALRETRIVLQALSLAVSEGQMNHVWDELPGTFLSLFEPTHDAGGTDTIRPAGA